MRRIQLLAIGLAFGCTVNAQTVFTYGNHKVTASEFLRAYNKNKTPSPEEESQLREYLELYSNFKLKVQAAKEMGFDTLSQIRADIQNFRQQVQENYMNDEASTALLFSEALQRSSKELHVLYFSVPVTEETDTLKAKEAIHAVYNKVKAGATDYPAIAKTASAITPSKFSDIGYISSFTLPYNFENIIYKLQSGGVSEPYRTPSGWHVFKVNNIRNNTGKWKVAQIMLSLPPGASAGEIAAIQRRADSVYQLAKGGRDFAELARQFSDDKLSYSIGGELPEFGAGKYNTAFEEKVHALKTDGEISKPFQTDFGIHIVKRLSHTPFPGLEDGSYQYDIRQKLLKDSRIEASREKFNRDIRSKTGFKDLKAVPMKDLLRYADSVMANLSMENADQFPISKKKIIQFKKSSLTGADWLRFVSDYKSNFELDKGEKGVALWDKFISHSVQQYYKDRLEEYNPEFDFQMKEFKEGNMLFEIMEKKVWGFASNDSAGLMQFYDQHKDKYKWDQSADVILVNAPTGPLAEEAMRKLTSGLSWKEISAIMPEIQADSGRYELSMLLQPGYTDVPGKSSYSSISKSGDGSFGFAKFIEIYPANQPKAFEDARGLVINDYQNQLEQEWLKVLKKKYPVQINESVVKSLMK